MEDKKPKSPPKGKTEKAAAGEKKSTPRKSGAASDAGKTLTESHVVPAEPVTLPSDWTGHGAIALVSHSSLGGITVIHTEMPPGTQIQPIVTTDSAGASVISLDGSAIPVPFSIPVSMAQPIPMSSEASSTSLSVPTLSVPASDGTLASVSVTPVVSTSSTLEAGASQTILAPVSEMKAASETDILHPSIQTVIVGEEQINAVQSDEQQRTADDPLAEPKEASAQGTL